MNIEHPDKLSEVLALLKKNGVRKFALGGLSVEFAPTEPAAPEPQPTIEDEKCRCGHAVHQHNDAGQCLIGCDVDKCAAPEK